MTERVVDVLEIVEVDEDDRNERSSPTSSGQGELEMVEDQRPVGQPGRRIVNRGVATHLYGVQQLGDRRLRQGIPIAAVPGVEEPAAAVSAAKARWMRAVASARRRSTTGAR